MTSEQFKRAVNTVGYAVIASPFRRQAGEPAIIPPFDDGVIEHPFRFERESTYEEVCAYTSAAYGKLADNHYTLLEWQAIMKAEFPGWTLYIARTD